MQSLDSHKNVTGFSGNEIFCLARAGYSAGRICFGNSVMSLGVAKGIGSTISNLAGGEVVDITNLIHEARGRAYHRMLKEAETFGANGIAGVSFDIINHGGQIEFIAVGSAVHAPQQTGMKFSAAASGQDLYCQLDAGFKPKGFVFGNIAYSIGVGGGLGGMFKSLQRGEVPQYTEIFTKTRHATLDRIKQHAKSRDANAVIGIKTTIDLFMGTQEMIMIGTASEHPALSDNYSDPVTSNLSSQELWNLVNMGYMPVKLVMGVSVYALGLAGGISSMFKGLKRGEIETTTVLLHEARDKAFELVHQEALECGADEVVGVKTRIYNLGGGLVEFMVIGTAVKKAAGITTKTPNLLPQAFTVDQDALFDSANSTSINPSAGEARSASTTQSGPLTAIGTFTLVVAYLLFIFFSH